MGIGDIFNSKRKNPQDTPLSDSASAPYLKPMPIDEAKLLWEQWKYRHVHFWNAFYLVSSVTAIISTLPVIKNSIISMLNWFSLAFPLLGLILGIFSLKVLRSEYERIGAVGDAYETSCWSFGTSRTSPKTDVGPPIWKLIRVPLSIVLLGIPTLALLAVAYVLLSGTGNVATNGYQSIKKQESTKGCLQYDRRPNRHPGSPFRHHR
ncbi:MAG: hypothetical protein ABFD52_01975 [Acidobacteriota bacterium]